MLVDDPMDVDAPLTKFAGISVPEDLMGKINDYLPLPAQVAFRRVCKGIYQAGNVEAYGFFTANLNKATREAQILKWHILHGFEASALRLLEEKPYLFFIETPAVAEFAKDHRGNPRKFKGSAFEAALAMGYTQLLNSKIAQDVIQANPKTVAAQVKKQLPNGFEFPLENEVTINRVFADFARALVNDKFPDGVGKASKATLAATAKFRDSFALTTVNQGWLFDLRILVKAVAVFNENWDKFNYEQCDWFACQIFGYFQTLVSTFDAQIIREGIETVLKGGKIGVVPSSLTLKDGNPYYRGRSTSQIGVGFDSFISNTYAVCLAGGWWRGSCGGLRASVEKLYRTKISELVQLIFGNTNQNKSTPSSVSAMLF